MKRTMLLAGGLVLLFAGIAFAADNFTFVIMSDRTGGADQPMFEKAVNEIALLRPDFVVTVGDLIEGYTANDVRAKQWNEVLPIMKRIGCPVYYTPGNHDIADVESARLFFEKTDRPPYYSFDKGQSHFIVLNTALAEAYDQLDLRQKKWLEEDLLMSQGKQHIFVFMHKTFWLYGAAANPANDPMHQLFRKYHVTAVFCGHGHSYVSQVIDGIRYAEIGATGTNVGAPNTSLGVFNQYAIARIQGKQFDFAVAEVGHIFGPELVSAAEAKLSEDIPNKYITYAAEIAEGLKKRETSLRLKINNINPTPIKGEYVFSAGQNWKVTPESVAVEIAPGDSGTVVFALKNSGNFYPLPRMKFTYPFGHGKRYQWDQEANVRRIAYCPAAAVAPVIDGVIGTGEWKQAAAVTQFADFRGNAAKTDPTDVYYLHDGTYLYIAANCTDSAPAKLKASAINRDDEVYNDDCFGFLISTDYKTVYQLYVNPKSVVWDQRIDIATGKNDEQWNSGVTVQAVQRTRGWSAEMKIPLSDLGLKTGDKPMTLRVNTRRKQFRTKESALWSTWWSNNVAQYNTIVLE